MNNGEVGISVIAPSRDGAGNAEALEHMAKVLGVSRKDISLSRGWSQSSKFLTVQQAPALASSLGQQGDRIYRVSPALYQFAPLLLELVTE